METIDRLTNPLIRGVGSTSVLQTLKRGVLVSHGPRHASSTQLTTDIRILPVLEYDVDFNVVRTRSMRGLEHFDGLLGPPVLYQSIALFQGFSPTLAGISAWKRTSAQKSYQ